MIALGSIKNQDKTPMVLTTGMEQQGIRKPTWQEQAERRHTEEERLLDSVSASNYDRTQKVIKDLHTDNISWEEGAPGTDSEKGENFKRLTREKEKKQN